MVCEGGEGVREDVPWGPKGAHACTSPRDLTQSRTWSGGGPPLDDVISKGLGGYLHQLVEAPPGVVRSFQDPELPCTRGRVVVGGVWWEVRRGKREKRSLYIGWEPLAGAPEGSVSDIPQCDQAALLESAKVALAVERRNVGGDGTSALEVNFPFWSKMGEGTPVRTPRLLPHAGVLVVGLIPVGWPGATGLPQYRAALSSSPWTAWAVLSSWVSALWAMHHLRVLM